MTTNEDIHSVILKTPQTLCIASSSSSTYNDSTSLPYNPGLFVCNECGRNFNVENYPSDYFKRLHFSFKKLPVGQLYDQEWVANSPVDENGLPENIINQGYFSRFFRVVEKLGRGSAGSVYLCKHVLNEVVLGLYAVKIVPIGNDCKWLNRVLKEVGLLERLHHENVIDYKHTWIEIFQPSAFGIPVPCLFILMEYANAGNLESFMHENLVSSCTSKQALMLFKLQSYGLGEERMLTYAKNVRNICIQICRGVQHLHELSIIHHDLKPQNILLKRADSALTVLLSDFGECELLSAIGHRERTGNTGTLDFMAPELLLSDEAGYYSHSYDCSSDIWSVGLVIYNLCFGDLPFKTEDISRSEFIEQLLQLDSNVMKFPQANPHMRHFEQIISQCLRINPQQRPTADQVLMMLNEMHLSKSHSQHQHQFWASRGNKKFLLISILICYFACKLLRGSYLDAIVAAVLCIVIRVY